MESSLSRQDIQWLVKKALQTPSGDNCQPWRFEWDGYELSLFHLNERAQHPLDPEGAVSILNLGLVLETLLIAATELHLQGEFELGELNIKSVNPWARVRFKSNPSAPDQLAEWIEKRSTDRRPFAKGDLSNEWFNEINQNFENEIKAKLFITKNISPTLFQYLVTAEEKLVQHPTAVGSIFKWIRFSSDEAQKSKDGILFQNTGASTSDRPFLKLLQRHPSLIAFFRPFLIYKLTKIIKRQLLSSAGLVAVAIPNDGDPRVHAVQAGRLMIRAWLMVTKNGFGVQPLSFSSCAFLYKKLNALDSFFQSEEKHLLKGEATFREAFNIPSDYLPIWIFRTGRVKDGSQKQRTPRRGVDDVLSFTEKN